MKKNLYKLTAFLAILVILTPLGLLAEGNAWGEWGYKDFKEMIGYIPSGLKRFAEFWSAPFSDYTIHGLGNIFGYIASAIIGIILIFAVIYLFGRFVSKSKNT